VVIGIIGVLAYFDFPDVFLGFAIGRSVKQQTAQIERARPKFNSAIVQNLNVGDSLEHARKVLSDAGLEFTIDKEASPPILRSVYPAGDHPGPGFLIQLELDTRDRIAKIDIQDYVDVP